MNGKTNETITVNQENGRLVVYRNGHRTYSIAASDLARNQYGNETGGTWGEEYERGIVAPVTNPDSDMYGALVAWE